MASPEVKKSVQTQLAEIVRLIAGVEQSRALSAAEQKAATDSLAAAIGALNTWKDGLLDDASIGIDKTWSSDKINAELTGIHDSITSINTTIANLNIQDWADKIAMLDSIDTSVLQSITDLQLAVSKAVTTEAGQVLTNATQVVVTDKIGAARVDYVQAAIGAALDINAFYAALIAAPAGVVVDEQAYLVV